MSHIQAEKSLIILTGSIEFSFIGIWQLGKSIDQVQPFLVLTHNNLSVIFSAKFVKISRIPTKIYEIILTESIQFDIICVTYVS